MGKHIWMEAAGWHNMDVTAEIDAVVRPMLVTQFGKGVGEEVRYSVNKRAGTLTIGVAQAEIDRVKAAKAKAVKASADKAAPGAVAGMAQMAQELEVLKALLAKLAGGAVASPAEGAEVAPKARGRKPKVA